MLVKTADYDDAGATLNALATEATAFAYQISHKFNNCAMAKVVLADKDGSIMRKYDVDAAGDSIYVGPGRVQIQEPAGTTIYDGRILDVLGQPGSITLLTEDWMNQLKDGRITYDMREKIYGNLRESTIYSAFSIPQYVPTGKTPIYAKANDGGVYTTETTEAADYVDDDMILMPAVPVVGDQYYYGFDTLTYDMFLDITTAGDWVGAMSWHYWNGSDWVVLAKVNSAHARWGYRTSGIQKYEWTAASWATCAVDGLTKYWIRSHFTTYTGITTQAKGGRCVAAPYHLYDNDVIITPDVHNGKWLVLTNGMAGSVKSSNGPYRHERSAGWDTELRTISGNMWYDSNTWYNHSLLESTTAGTYVSDYWFKVPIGISEHMVELTAAQFNIVYTFAAIDTTAVACTCSIQYYNFTTTNWVEISKVSNDIGDYNKSVRTFSIPYTAMGNEAAQDFINADGDAKIRFEVVMQNNADTVNLKVYYLQLEIDATTTAYTDVLEILDCGTRFITVGHDITETDEALWADCPYCIAEEIWNHINPIVLAGDNANLIELTTNVEETTGISTMHYEESTRFEVLQSEAKGDQAVFYLPLDTLVLQYKKTFAAGGTAMTDAGTATDKLIKWSITEWDWKKVVNERHIYGMRIGDEQVYLNTADLGTDPGATSKITYGVTKSEITRVLGLTTKADAIALGEALVTKEDDVLLLLKAEIVGLATLRLGDRVDITSTLLGLTSADYVVVAWDYDSKTYKTTLTLHPRTSIGYMEYKSVGEGFRDTADTANEARRNLYLPTPAGTEFA